MSVHTQILNTIYQIRVIFLHKVGSNHGLALLLDGLDPDLVGKSRINYVIFQQYTWTRVFSLLGHTLFFHILSIFGAILSHQNGEVTQGSFEKV